MHLHMNQGSGLPHRTVAVARLLLAESLSHFCVMFCSVEGLTLSRLLMYLFLLIAHSHRILSSFFATCATSLICAL